MEKITEEQLERVFDAIRDNEGLEVLSKKGREAVRYYLQQFDYLEEPKDLMEQIADKVNNQNNYIVLEGNNNDKFIRSKDRIFSSVMRQYDVLDLYNMFLKVIEDLKEKKK